MKSLLVTLIVAISGLARADPSTSKCADVFERLDDLIADAEAHPIALTDPPQPRREGSGDPDEVECPLVEDPSLKEAGLPPTEYHVDTMSRLLSGRRAVVRMRGPHGSDYLEEIEVRVGKIGVCLMESWHGFKRLSLASVTPRHPLPRQSQLDDGKFHLLSILEVEHGAENDLGVVLVYRLKGDLLVLDRDATRAAIRQIGSSYAAATPGSDQVALFHAAAQAYEALATKSACPNASPPSSPHGTSP